MAETAEFNTTTLIVDDTSNLIEYSAGWTSGFSGDGVSDADAEYMRTKHGTKTAGTTAKFNFTGTSIAVYGSLGSVDVYGVPMSSYSVDGSYTATYTAPIIQPGEFLTHVVFYQSPILPPGTHELAITNLNGSAPSVLWIDFFYYDPSPSTGETGGGAALIPSSSTDMFTVSSMSTTISSSTTSMLASPDATPLSSPSIDAIVVGTVGGISALLLLSSSALLLQCYRRRRRKQSDLYEHATTLPFDEGISSFRDASGSLPISDIPSTNTTNSNPQNIGTTGTSAAMSIPSTIWHTDSGMRLPSFLEVPPGYTQN